MNSIKYLTDKSKTLLSSYSFNKELGQGSDGQIFDLGNQVIKLCILFDVFDISLEKKYDQISLSLDYIYKNKPSAYCPIFKYGFLDSSFRIVNNCPQKYILYYYVMEKLFSLSEDERRVFHSLLSHEDRGIVKPLCSARFDEMMGGLRQALDFDVTRVKLFCDNIRASKLKHLDLVPRNIMKNANGDFLLIDFDRTNFHGMDITIGYSNAYYD
jgi:hypothetical protein